jgi:hypothetical protein
MFTLSVLRSTVRVLLTSDQEVVCRRKLITRSRQKYVTMDEVSVTFVLAYIFLQVFLF